MRDSQRGVGASRRYDSAVWCQYLTLPWPGRQVQGTISSSQDAADVVHESWQRSTCTGVRTYLHGVPRPSAALRNHGTIAWLPGRSQALNFPRPLFIMLFNRLSAVVATGAFLCHSWQCSSGRLVLIYRPCASNDRCLGIWKLELAQVVLSQLPPAASR
jgi:hypothetical protein